MSLSRACAALKGGATKAIAHAPQSTNAKKPINQIQVFALLAGQVPRHRVAMLVEEREIDFEPDDEYLGDIRLAGGEDEQVLGLSKEKCIVPRNRRKAGWHHV